MNIKLKKSTFTGIFLDEVMEKHDFNSMWTFRNEKVLLFVCYIEHTQQWK